MRKKVLDLLDSLLRSGNTKEKRITKLLKDPDAEYTEGWYMCVPKCFNEALDIKYTMKSENKIKKLVRTQGTTFSFKEGDTLYDTPKAYLQWSEALSYINLCVQVEQASDVVPPSKGEKRHSGYVFFRILTPSGANKIIVTRSTENDTRRICTISYWWPNRGTIKTNKWYSINR